MSTKKGFTLIESLIYIFLFAIIIGGGMLGVYQIITSTDRVAGGNSVEQEASFIMRKLDWALTGADPSLTFLPNGNPGNKLDITRSDGLHLIFDLDTATKRIRVKEGVAGSFQALNSSGPVASDLVFKYIAAPAQIKYSFKLNNQLFGTSTKYLR